MAFHSESESLSLSLEAFLEKTASFDSIPKTLHSMIVATTMSIMNMKADVFRIDKPDTAARVQTRRTSSLGVLKK